MRAASVTLIGATAWAMVFAACGRTPVGGPDPSRDPRPAATPEPYPRGWGWGDGGTEPGTGGDGGVTPGGDGGTATPLPEPSVDGPVVSADPRGGLFRGPVTVTLRANVEGTVIHFTSDGTDPREGRGQQHAAPFLMLIERNTTLNFVGQDPQGRTGATVREVYVLDDRAPTTTLTPPPGRYEAPLRVTLSTDETAVIRFSVDGGAERHAPAPAVLDLPRSATLRFSALDGNGNAEPWRSARYDLAPPKATLAGKVIVADDLREWDVTVGVVEREGGQWVLFQRLGPTGDAGFVSYRLSGLSAGQYLALAAVDVENDGDDSNDLFAFAGKNPVRLDPEDPRRRVAEDVDIYLGLPDPNFNTVHGDVVLAPELRDSRVTVMVWRGDQVRFGSEVVSWAVAGVADADGRASYRVGALPDGEYALAAVADVLRDGNDAEDRYGVYDANPVAVQGQDDVRADIYLEVARPELGAIAGNVVLSAPLRGGRVIVVLFAEDPYASPNPAVAQLVRVDNDGTSAVLPYEAPNLPAGRYWPAVSVRSEDGKETFRLYTTPFDPSASVEVAPPGRVLGVDIPVGVGRVAGSIRVEGAPASLSRVGVAAMGPIWPVAWEDVAVAGTGGSRVGTFHMFGLDDGEYPMFAVPDLDGDGDFGNDMQRGRAFPGEPDRVVIANGGNATCDFSFSLGAP